MKKRNLILVATASLLAAACGKMEQDPLKKNSGDGNLTYRDIYNKSVVPYEQAEPGKKSIMVDLFYIDAKTSLDFVQGETNSVTFETRLSYFHPEEVKYDLVMVEGPAQLGAKFIKTSANTWSLSWTPGSRILSSYENSKRFPLRLAFQLKAGSSAQAFKMFKGYNRVKSFEITLHKDPTQPVIEDLAGVASINPDDKIKIPFVVSVKGIDKVDSLQVSATRGPEFNKEFAQMNALEGGALSWPEFVADLGVDKKTGARRLKYVAEFQARPFMNAYLGEMNSHVGVLKNKFLQGKIEKVEAVFQVVAYNDYNSERSAEKMITVNVNLNIKPSKAVLVGNESMQLDSGSKSTDRFSIMSDDLRSRVEIKSVLVGDKEVPLGQEFSDGNMKMRLACANGTGNQYRMSGCAVKGCYQSCAIEVQASCDESNRTLNLKIMTSTQIANQADALSTALNYAISVKGSNPVCVAAKAAMKTSEAQPAAGGKK